MPRRGSRVGCLPASRAIEPSAKLRPAQIKVVSRIRMPWRGGALCRVWWGLPRVAVQPVAEGRGHMGAGDMSRDGTDDHAVPASDPLRPIHDCYWRISAGSACHSPDPRPTRGGPQPAVLPLSWIGGSLARSTPRFGPRPTVPRGVGYRSWPLVGRRSVTDALPSGCVGVCWPHGATVRCLRLLARARPGPGWGRWSGLGAGGGIQPARRRALSATSARVQPWKPYGIKPPRPSGQPRRTRTAPVVRFPRRSTRYSPCSRSASAGTASCSVTFSLFR
jgi:hypothetical protein